MAGTQKKRTIVAVAGLFLLLAVPCFASGDFAGVWVMDAQRSQSVSPGMKQTLKVSQNDNTIDVETNTEQDGKSRLIHDTFVLDGKTYEVPSQHVTLGIKGTARRKAQRTDGAAGFEVIDEGSYETEFGPVTDLRKRTWTLSSDSKALTITTYLQGAIVERIVTRVYVRP